MGRRERPLDPTAGPVAQFACELRKLRQEAGGVTYRVMAAKAHYSAATLAQAAAGDRLPSLSIVLAYVGACGGDRAEWEQRWHETAREVSEQAREAEDGSEPPYRGLARFGIDDHEWFFGRDQLVDQLMDLVGRKQLVTVTGPSGSGKSSVLRAGLIARMQRTASRQEQPAVIRVLTPGPNPARTHAGILDPETAPARTVIVVDQLEEVFTLCADPAERARFLDLLCALRSAPGIRVVVAIRADFYGHLTRHRRIAEAAQDATLLVAPMNHRELREAIVRPAALGGLVVERALTARIIRDVADEAGGLPLMSHALLETWRRRSGRVLTEAAYDAAGGIRGAITRTAEDFYGRLTPEQAETARRILLRLVTPGQGNQDTRRPADRGEITTLGPAAASDADLVLDRLARDRLVTIDRDTVHLSHEAVLSAWPRLRAWIEEDRDRLRTQLHLTEATHTWQTLGKDPGSLYRGVRLSVAEAHCAGPGRRDDLTPAEREFLTASLAARARDRRQRHTRTAALSVLVVLSLVAALTAWQQNRSGERGRQEAEARRVAAVADSLRPSDPQTAMRLSLAAWQVADLPETRSALLAAASEQEQDVFTDPDSSPATMRRLSADGSTLISIGADHVTHWDVSTHRRLSVLPGLGRSLDGAASPRTDAGWLPVFVDNRVAVRDLATGRSSGLPLADADNGVEMSPSGRLLTVYDRNDTQLAIQLWDPQTRRKRLQIELEVTGRRADRTDVTWENLSALHRTYSTERRGGHDHEVPGVPDAILSADDRYLAVCVPGQRLQLWDVAKKRRLTTPWLPRVTERQCAREQIEFSADSSHLAIADDTGFRTWSIMTGRELPKVVHSGLSIVELGEGGSFMAAADGSEILVWRLAAPQYPVYRHRLSGETVKEIRLDTRAGILRYVGGPAESWGPSVHTLTLGPAGSTRWTDVPSLASTFGPDGATMATAVPDPDSKRIQFRVVDTRTGKTLAGPPSVTCPVSDAGTLASCQVLMDLDSTGEMLAYGVRRFDPATGPPGSLATYDVSRRRITTVLGADELGASPPSYVTFGPQDHSLLLSDIPGYGSAPARIWDLRRRTTTRTIPGAAGRAVLHPDGDLVVSQQGRAYQLPSGTGLPAAQGPGVTSAAAFSPDGRYLAAGDSSGRVVLWEGHLTRRLGVLASGTTHSQYVSALAYSPDSRMLAVAADEGTLQLWDTASHQPIGTPLPTPGDTINALSFNADGSRLYASGARTPLQTYDIALDTAAERVCRRVTKGLTPLEWRLHLPGVPYQQTCP
ncbi:MULTISPECIES: NACHT and WD repeat domain-containing protein [unclassified Streptomyces]|uniref:NACHT and WD repeat domain-containing protein n=1 Tax=unclassified Streptomyces TaxID=2593676 RepID=UPI002E22D269